MAITDSPPTSANYGITLPEVGKDRDSWGSKLNAAFQSLENETYTVDQILGEASDSATPSLAYNLTQASTNASTAKTNSETAISVANKSINTTLTTLTSRVSTLETTIGSVGVSGSLADDARDAKTDAAAAKTAAESALGVP